MSDTITVVFEECDGYQAARDAYDMWLLIGGVSVPVSDETRQE